MSSDPLRGPKLKIKGAKRHIENLDPVLEAYFGGDPYEMIRELQIGGLQEALILKATKPIPEEAYTLVGDAVHNLRSALDHLAVALALANGASKTSDVYFPFGRTKEIFESSAKEKIKRLSADARDLVHSLKPYKGGNNFLFALHELDCTDKHEMFVAVGTAMPNIKGTFSISARFNFHMPEWPHDLAKGVTILSFPPGTEVKYDFNISTDISFSEAEAVKGQPVRATLEQFVQLVESILLTFETRFFS